MTSLFGLVRLTSSLRIVPPPSAKYITTMAHHESHPPTHEECQEVAANLSTIRAEVELLSKEVEVDRVQL